MRRKRLTYAMVGGGRGSFIGPVHREAIRMDDLADLVAGCFTRDGAANAEVGAELGLSPKRVYPDWQALVAGEAGKVDFLAVCTPNASHFPIAKAALEAGMNVMCEKPLAMTRAEAETLARLAQEKGLALGVPFTYSGFPMVKLARDLVRQGELGRIDKVVVGYQQGSFRKIDFRKPLDKRNAWKMDPRQSGPSCCLADIGVHALHVAEYVTGLEVESLLADVSSFAPGDPLEDDASVLLHFAGGAKGVFVISKIATGEENGLRVRVYGDKASLLWEQESPNHLHVKYPFAPERIYRRNAPYVAALSENAKRASRTPAGHHEGFIEAFANHYREFCAALRAPARPRDFPTAREGVRCMAFVEAALKSAKAGSRWRKL